MKNKAITALLYTIVIFLIIVNATLFYQSRVNPDKVPSFCGYKLISIISGSMENNIKVGQKILVRDADSLDVGDVATFREEGSLVTHRIIGKTENGYLTKGDANSSVDDLVRTSDTLEGKVVFIFPQLIKFLSPFGIPGLVVLTLLVASLIICLKKLFEEDNPQVADCATLN